MPYVQPLGALSRTDVALAGGKGSNLGELVRAGFAVPDGFVVTTQLYREARATARSDEQNIPAQLATVITDAYAELGAGAVAVRSSATAEDLPGAAFAGQQETFLNVIGPDLVLEAVRACWASLWGERAVAYRSRIGYVGEVEIAVVVQRMVDADWAGVLFTANPVTGDRGDVVVEASPGLGEAVVSGQVTPDHVIVDAYGSVRARQAGGREVVVRPVAGGGTRTQAASGDEEALPEEVYGELAAVGRQIQAHFGSPQDIEWAYAEGRMWIVQARPLTALPPAPLRVNRVRRESARICAELLPVRPYPLDITAWTVPGWFAILARMLGDVAAVRVDVGAMFPEQDGVVTQLVPPDPRPTWRTLVTPLRILPLLRRHDPAHWSDDPRFAAFEQRLGQLQRQDLASLTWSALVRVPRQVLQVLDAYVDLRIDYLPGFGLSLLRLRLLLAVLGLSSEFWPLLQGQATRTRDANTGLDGLAAMIRHGEVWAAAFAGSDSAQLARTLEQDPAFATLNHPVTAWLAEFGHRDTTSAALLSAGTWAEDPSLLLASLQALVNQPAAEPSSERPGAAVASELRRRRRVRLTHSGALITGAADAARAALVFREDTHFHALRLRPVSRRAVLEAGERLTASGVLAERNEVFHLRLEELEDLDDPALLDASTLTALAETVQQRKATRAGFGEAPLVSPLTLFPEERRARPEALVSGAAGGGGRATGPVRIIREPAEFGRLRPGDVLVCAYTNPAWTPLFQLAAAVVADSGSFGSHAAIVAREYGIPAVMGTGDGTRVLTDGRLVEVDGNRGDVVAVEARETR